MMLRTIGRLGCAGGLALAVWLLSGCGPAVDKQYEAGQQGPSQEQVDATNQLQHLLPAPPPVPQAQPPVP